MILFSTGVSTEYCQQLMMNVQFACQIEELRVTPYQLGPNIGCNKIKIKKLFINFFTHKTNKKKKAGLVFAAVTAKKTLSVCSSFAQCSLNYQFV